MIYVRMKANPKNKQQKKQHIHPGSLTSPLKMMVGRLLSLWDGKRPCFLWMVRLHGYLLTSAWFVINVSWFTRPLAFPQTMTFIHKKKPKTNNKPTLSNKDNRLADMNALICMRKFSQ